ncbi:MAG: PD-(D/E)XK nuclease family protein [bacterium]|nr:PD-(D/E)XK nuclease family protein [bacterium]MDZ4296307.1 PD-(D/E)XK nuclease family protein [Patescibacteria group bacterium]
MSQYYFPKRTRNLFEPGAREPFRVSRSKLDLFLNCPRCFYLDRRLGVGQPPGFPFSLNSAVDILLKKEFDIHRARHTVHPLMKAYGIDAVPFEHPKMAEWRDAFRRGIQYLHEPTNLILTGGIDDVWVNPRGELMIVDYKATAKNGEVSLDADWQIGYKRQMEVYQWLFRKNGFTVSATGYFVYCNGDMDKEAFDGKLEFDVKILPYTGADAWIEDALFAVTRCLTSEALPATGPDCDFCRYRKAVADVEAPLLSRHRIKKKVEFVGEDLFTSAMSSE